MDLNRDVQSVHHIIHLFERAHLRGEKMLDGLPALFSVVDKSGQVYRGNKYLGNLIEVGQEHLLGESIAPLFSAANWTIFQARLQGLIAAGKASDEFELELDGLKQKRTFVWYLVPLRHEYEVKFSLVTVFAVDVSELKTTMQQKARMQIELKTAKAVQETLLPPPEASFAFATVSGRYRSASECGGDLWFYKQIDDQLLVCIADVTGHGASAALLASAARAVLSVDAVISTKSPAKILATLNNTMIDLANRQSCMTSIVGVLNGTTGEFTYGFAAHDPLLFFPAQTGHEASSLIKIRPTTPGNLLGLERDIEYHQQSIFLHPGDRLFFYSDGLLDLVVDESNRKIGARRIYKLVGDFMKNGANVREVAEHVDHVVSEFSLKYELEDDVTFFLVQYK